MQKHTLPDLPYAYNALEPFIDEETMRLHHDKHHASYVNNLNTVLEKFPELQEKTAEELIENLNDVTEEIRIAVRNNAGGHVNHSMFWQIMSPVRNHARAGAPEGPLGRAVSNGVDSNASGLPAQAGEPSGKLAEEIKKYFGSFADFQNKFNDTGTKRFGSGWVWLVRTKDGKLDIATTANQDNPISEGNHPIMGNDVWEHAYYLKYKNMRAEYLKVWWNVVNWQEVSKRFES